MRFRTLAAAGLALALLGLGGVFLRSVPLRHRAAHLLPAPVRTVAETEWHHVRNWKPEPVALPAVQAAPPMPEAAKTAFQLRCAASNFHSLQNGGAILPEIIPAGLKGTVGVGGHGVLKLSPAGCLFLHGGQQKQDTAWLQFAGRGVGEVFDSSTPGSVAFTIRSTVSFADRLENAQHAGHVYRQILDVYDDVTGQMQISVTPHDGLLAMIYSIGAGPAVYHFFPGGKEEELFGRDVAMRVKLAWDGRGTSELFINDQLVETKTYGRTHPAWTPRASFSIGARDQHEYGGGFFSASDVAISDFSVRSSGPYKDVTPPEVSFRYPADGQKVAGSMILEAAASDDDAVAGVRFLADGTPLLSVPSYPYRCLWDAHALPPGRHTLVAEASDAAGNVGRKQIAVTVEASPTRDTQPPDPVSSLYTAELRSRLIRIAWAPAADNVAVASYRVYRDGKPAGSVPAVSPSPALLDYADSAVEPEHTYGYQVEAVDAAGNAAPLSAPLVLTAPAKDGAVLHVGPGQKYAAPCAAIAAAHPGDTIEIDAAGNGTYDGDVCVWNTDRLTIRGVNGRPRIDAHGRSANGKGVWVIAGRDNTVENVEISGASSGDRNGAAIRLEGRGAVIRHVYFHHDEDGILATVEGGNLLIEFSEFGYDGDGSGQSHNLYITNLDSLVFRYNYSHHAKIGHLLKSRARRNEIYYNRLTDETGTASYEMEFPNGGANFVVGNILQQSTTTDNENIVSCGSEGLRPNLANALYFIHNTVVDEKQGGRFFNVVPMPVRAVDNIFSGTRTVLELPSGAELRDNFIGNPGFVNAAVRDYRLKPDSPARGAGHPTGSGPAGAPPLEPAFRYVHPAGGCQLKPGVKLNIGAL
jgi:hypothetical protein